MTDFGKIKKLLDLKQFYGFSEKEISNMLDLVGKLPKILLDYYLELGNCDFNYYQDYLVKPSEYNKFLVDKYVIICSENQSVCFAGIRKEDLLQDNPPVFFTSDMENWEMGCNNLFNYLHGFAYVNLVCSLKYNGYFDLSDYGVNFIRNNFANKNIVLRNWWSNDGEIEFFGDYDDTIMMLNAETSLFYASNNEKHYVAMENKWKGIDIEYK